MRGSELNRFPDTLSPLSWGIIALSYIAVWQVVFQPTLIELIGLMALDVCVFTPILIGMVERFVFPRLFPDARVYFNGIDYEQLAQFTLEEQKRLLASLLSFPKRRATYALIAGFAFKIVPGTAVIVFIWQHQCSNWEQFLKLIAVFLVGYSYFYGAVFIENHMLVTRTISEIHRRLNWTAAFAELRLPYSRQEFEREESIVIAAIWVFMLALEALIATSYVPTGSQGAFRHTAQLSTVGVFGLALASRVWYTNRRFFMSGLENLFKMFEGFEPHNFQQTLPLHSSPLLARFEAIFNQLVSRLKANEQELSRWVFNETERTRFRTLGEMSALVTHDLSNPVHVMDFCAQRLLAQPERIFDEAYRTQLAANSARIKDLVESLRAYVRDPDPSHTASSFLDSHTHVLRLLEFQFSSHDLSRITIEALSDWESVRPAIPRSYLIHILYNLYANAIKNLITHSVAAPRLTIERAGADLTWVEILVSDNGTGLTAKEYDGITAYAFQPSHAVGARKGLGLRLIRRLIEQADGRLEIIDPPRLGHGTTLSLKLRMREPDRQASD